MKMYHPHFNYGEFAIIASAFEEKKLNKKVIVYALSGQKDAIEFSIKLCESRNYEQ